MSRKRACQNESAVRICPVLWSTAKDLLIQGACLPGEFCLTRSSKDPAGSSRTGLIQCGEHSATDSMLSVYSVETS